MRGKASPVFKVKFVDMSRMYISLALATIVLAGYSCSSSKVSSNAGYPQNNLWQSQPLTIDGDNADWPRPLPYHDDKEKLDYFISNDSTNLYIALSTKDEQTQQKILQGGLTVWLNTTAEKTNQGAAGISFPTGAGRSRGRTTLPISGPAASNKVIALDNVTDYTLFGFSDKGVESFDYGQANNQGIELKIAFNNAGELIYEAAVPLRAIYPRSGTTRFAGRNIAVGFIIDGIPPQPGDREDGGGVSIGGGVGMGSYGSGGGVGLSIGSGALGRIGGKGKRFKQSKIWQVVSLAKPQQSNQ